MTDVAPRLSDDELTALLARHVEGRALQAEDEDGDPIEDLPIHECAGCLLEVNVWPCETVRLAKMAQDLLAVRDAVEANHYQMAGDLGGIYCHTCLTDWPCAEAVALARYEEGGR